MTVRAHAFILVGLSVKRAGIGKAMSTTIASVVDV
jgi:hypothetical protein